MGKIILALIVLAGIAFAGWYAFPFLTKNQKPTPGTAQITPAPQATVTPASALSSPSGILNKDQLKVSVLNGTGIAGQAAKVKDLLVSLGLSKIETGNVSGETVNETTAVFSSAVATDLQKQIITLLEENYASVSAKKSTASPSADIVITTGKPK